MKLIALNTIHCLSKVLQFTEVMQPHRRNNIKQCTISFQLGDNPGKFPSQTELIHTLSILYYTHSFRAWVGITSTLDIQFTFFHPSQKLRLQDKLKNWPDCYYSDPSFILLHTNASKWTGIQGCSFIQSCDYSHWTIYIIVYLIYNAVL